jgi:hypothetical protein
MTGLGLDLSGEVTRSKRFPGFSRGELIVAAIGGKGALIFLSFSTSLPKNVIWAFEDDFEKTVLRALIMNSLSRLKLNAEY